MRFALFLAFCSLISIITSPVTHAQQRDDRRLTMNQRLAREVSVDITDEPLVDVLAEWSRTNDIQLVVDWRGLRDVGVERADTLTLQLRSVSAGHTLELILQAVQPEPVGDEAIFAQAFDRYVEVLPKRTANRRPEVYVYDIRALILPEHDNFGAAPRFDLESALSDSTGQSGDGSIFQDDDPDEHKRLTPRQRAERIMDALQEHIEPAIWEANGGDVATMRYFDGQLIIRAPGYVQAQVPLPGQPLRED